MAQEIKKTEDIVGKILADRKNSNLILKLEDSLMSSVNEEESDEDYKAMSSDDDDDDEEETLMESEVKEADCREELEDLLNEGKLPLAAVRKQYEAAGDVEKPDSEVEKSDSEVEKVMKAPDTKSNDVPNDENTVETLKKVPSSTVKTIKDVRRLFTHFVKTEEMVIEENCRAKNDAEIVYKEWLDERYKVIKQALLNHLTSKEETIVMAAFITLFKLLDAEIEHPLKQFVNDAWNFPKDFLKDILKTFVYHDSEFLLTAFRTRLDDDIRFYSLKCLHSLIQENNDEAEQFFTNVFQLLKMLTFPKSFETTCNDDISETESVVFTLKKKPFAKAFSQVWIEFLKHKLPISLYKQVLSYLPVKVLPHMNDPLKLTDFFTESYALSGVISLLALNGIYYLIQHHNLEYKGFYPKLYSLFTKEVVTSKYRVRFFHLTDLFLSSTHLPSYLVASFVKRLSRLSLSVPPTILVTILPFIGNLIIRHPTLQILINSPSVKEISCDPFLFEEEDPTRTEAMSSSLWEIELLQRHWHPDVSKAAKFINSKMSDMEKDISKFSDYTFEKAMTQESRRKFKKVALSYDKPKGFFLRKEDEMNDLWK